MQFLKYNIRNKRWDDIEVVNTWKKNVSLLISLPSFKWIEMMDWVDFFVDTIFATLLYSQLNGYFESSKGGPHMGQLKVTAQEGSVLPSAWDHFSEEEI